MERHFSKEEAQQIFAAAAERQQASKRREPALTLAELEEAGRAAGIDAEYIRLAAAHLLSPEKSTVAGTYLGIPVELRKSRRFDGEISGEQWARIVLELRKMFKKNGVVSELGPLREWASVADDQRMPYRVVVEPEADGTRVTFERKTWQSALGLGIGAGVNLLMGIIMLIISIFAGADGEQWVPGIAMTTFGFVFGIAAYFGLRFQRIADARKIDEAFDRIAEILSTPEATPSAAGETTASRPPLSDALEGAQAYADGASLRPAAKFRTGKQRG